MIKKIIAYFNNSLTARLTLWVSVVVVLLFVISITMLFHFSHRAIEEKAFERANQALENTLLQAGNTISEVEFAANNTLWVVERNVRKPDSMFVYSAQILKMNPHLYGCSIAFEPYYYIDRGEYFSANSYIVNDTVYTRQEGSAKYKYFHMDWYLIPRLLNAPYWTDSYRDDFAEDSTFVHDHIISYCMPIHNNDGWNIGVLAVDISLSWFSQTVSGTKPFPNSYSIMLGKNGSYLVHPDSTKLYCQSLLTPFLEHPDSVYEAMAGSMLAGESGYHIMRKDGENYYVFYKPVPKTDWCVAIVCPEDDIFGPYKELQTTLIVIVSLGLLFLIAFMVVVIRYHMKPLHQLVTSAKSFSEGRFDVETPDNSRSNEIAVMQHSFAKMQHSLGDYINNIQQSTTVLQKRNEELSRANELSLEDNRIKNAVITHMTNEMNTPINHIVDETKIISSQFKDLSEEEMRQHVDCMLKNSDEVTKILDLILEASNTQKNTDDV